jgi:hypothetical protein
MLRANSLDEARRSEIDAAIVARGGVACWRNSPGVDRAYALIEFPDDVDLAGLVPDATLAIGAPTIALAVSPSVVEALPVLVDALGGPGRPSGVTDCALSGGAAIVEWDLERTPAALILDMIDAELDRFHSGRTTELLTPLSEDWLARIAAEGLACPDIAPDRILETLLARAGLTSTNA